MIRLASMRSGRGLALRLTSCATKFRRMRRPASPDFSGWNCTPSDVRLLDRGRERLAVGRQRTRRTGHRCRERVREVHVRLRLHAVEQRRRRARWRARSSRRGESSGSLRDRRAARTCPQQTQSPALRCLGAALEQPLHAEADAQQRPPAADTLENRVFPRLVERSGRAEVSDTRHDDPGRTLEVRRRSRHEHSGTQPPPGPSAPRSDCRHRNRRATLASSACHPWASGFRPRASGRLADPAAKSARAGSTCPRHRSPLTSIPSCSATRVRAGGPWSTPRAVRARTP